MRASLVEPEMTPDSQNPVAVGQVRVRCALPQAPIDIAREYAARYTNNQNPQLTTLRLLGSNGEKQTDYLPGQAFNIEGSWMPGTAEPFVSYDKQTSQLVEATEVLTMSWFVTAGTLDVDRTEAESGEARVRAQWTAPEIPQTVRIWAVLRDNRGGMSWSQLSVDPK